MGIRPFLFPIPHSLFPVKEFPFFVNIIPRVGSAHPTSKSAIALVNGLSSKVVHFAAGYTSVLQVPYPEKASPTEVPTLPQVLGYRSLNLR